MEIGNLPESSGEEDVLGVVFNIRRDSSPDIRVAGDLHGIYYVRPVGREVAH